MYETDSFNPVNKELFDKCEKFLKKSLSLIQAYLGNGKAIPYEVVEKTVILDEGRKIEQAIKNSTSRSVGSETISYGVVETQQPLFRVFLETLGSAIKQLEEYKECTRCMKNDPSIAKHLDKWIAISGFQIFTRDWDYLSHMLMKLMKPYYESKLFDEKLFLELYRDLESLFYRDTIPVIDIIALLNFKAEIDDIDLGEGISIRKFTSSEKEQIINDIKWLGDVRHTDILACKYVAEFRYESKKIIDGEQQNTDSGNNIDKLISAFRLFKEGIVGYNMIFAKWDLCIPLRPENTISQLSFHDFAGKRYDLSSDEVQKFLDLWKLIKDLDISTDTPINIAIRRFNYAYEREKAEDKLVDYMIAFEALYFKSGETGELLYRLATRVSRLLRQSFEDRKLVFKKMKDFYDKRSAVVHGEPTNIGQDFLNEVEDYLRNSIKTFLKELTSHSHQDIIDSLDLG